jgi:hypothetical protein
MDIRRVYNILNKPLIPLDTVASFADNLDLRTLVTLSSGSLNFFTQAWFIFDSTSYKDVYEGEFKSTTELIINTPFNGDDTGVNVYDVSEVYAFYNAAFEYISSLPCAVPHDPLTTNYINAVWYYALYLYQTSPSRELKRHRTDGRFENEYFARAKGANNEYFIAADQLLKGCLSAQPRKVHKPTIITYKV